jgi:multidrug efflux pump subunit AcrA (membrane-fusion protein)
MKLYEQKMADERDGAPVRKRERLTHLSPEEKMWRRKMKNRIAAQTARDRKKARMDNIEDAVQKLERQNRTLAAENAQLRKQNAELLAKMNAIEQRSERNATVDAQINSPMNTTVESAVLINVLQPREQDVTLAQLITLLCTYVTLICNESSTISSGISPLKENNNNSNMSTLLTSLTQQQRNHLAMNIRQLMGRHHHRRRSQQI